MWIAYAAEFWVYPFLRVMPNTARAAFFVVCGCIIAFLYFLGKWMTIFIWGGRINCIVPKKYPYPSHTGFFGLTPHSLLKILAFEIPLPLGISNDPSHCGYGYFLELPAHILSQGAYQ